MNIIFRFLMGDNGEQSLRARDILFSVQKGNLVVWYESVILAEVVWVLSSFYKIERVKIKDLLLPLLQMENFRIPDKEKMMKALKFFPSSIPHFCDACLCAAAFDITEEKMLSFDKKTVSREFHTGIISEIANPGILEKLFLKRSCMMKSQKRIADYGVTIGTMPRGPRNAITDVRGVLVGHCTLTDGPVQTGVTAILPHGGNIFRDKLFAACHVINGFGKSAGLVQIDEMGTLETPILLTNTLSVGTVSEALTRYMLKDNTDIGRETGTVNPAVCECNDGYLNDIRGFHVREEHVLQAIASAGEEFEEGAVGAGRGMSCYQLKGGIGTASRRIDAEGTSFTLGVLVLSNFGRIEDLRVDGQKIGSAILDIRAPEDEQGSIIAVLATDIPLTERQLARIARRVSVGITRTGAFIGSGSGEIVLAFTTVNRFSHDETAPVVPLSMFNENSMDLPFRAAVDATEEAVLNSMVCAESVRGRDGHFRPSLAQYASLFARGYTPISFLSGGRK